MLNVFSEGALETFDPVSIKQAASLPYLRYDRALLGPVPTLSMLRWRAFGSTAVSLFKLVQVLHFRIWNIYCEKKNDEEEFDTLALDFNEM